MADFSKWIHYRPQVWQPSEADQLFSQLEEETPWQQPNITVFGKTYPVPRLTAWYADAGLQYEYSGIAHQPLAWTPALQGIKARVERQVGCGFNSVLLNLYRDGRDSNGWHADNEAELDSACPIASVSFGAVRRFRMRLDGETSHLDLQHGSLLLMRAGAQQQMQHCVPKTARAVGPRINLTFRVLHRH